VGKRQYQCAKRDYRGKRTVPNHQTQYSVGTQLLSEPL
jgi:hypothetical protein